VKSTNIKLLFNDFPLRKQKQLFRRVRINEFPQTYGDEDGFMSDESEYEGGHTPRRGGRRRSRLDHLDIALDEAVAQGRQLKNMSRKMKDSLRDDLLDL
jgi:hypothetical protein